MYAQRLASRAVLRLLTIVPLALAGCLDQELPTAPAPERPAFDHVGDSYVVTTTADGGEGSLRYAIEHVAAGGTITFAAALTGQTILLTSGQLTISRDLTISGPGADLLAVRRSVDAPDFRIFGIECAGVTVTISGLTIANGQLASGGGGGIRNSATLTLIESVVSGNIAQTAGGIYSTHGGFCGGSLTLIRSTVSGNVATNTRAGLGGGIGSFSAPLTIIQSTISGNSSHNAGGGIYHNRAAFGAVGLTLVNSTISGNVTAGIGGGIAADDGVHHIVHSTITGNRALTGGGLRALNSPGPFGSIGSSTAVKGSIIWGNTTLDGITPDDVADIGHTIHYPSLGYNLIGAAGQGVDFSVEFNQTGDQTNVADAGLGDLAANGGSTWTHALLAGSPAIDTGTCSDHTGTTVSVDQRGESRPQPAAGSCDIGAFELVQLSPPPSCNGVEIRATRTSGPDPVAPGESASWTVTLEVSACEDVNDVTAQGGGAAWATTDPSTGDGAIEVRKETRKNNVLLWTIGAMQKGDMATATLYVSGSVGEKVACGSGIALTGEWSATADAGAGAQKYDTAAPVAVTVGGC